MQLPTTQVFDAFCLECGVTTQMSLIMECVVCSQCDEVVKVVDYIVLLSAKWQNHLWDQDIGSGLDV